MTNLDDPARSDYCEGCGRGMSYDADDLAKARAEGAADEAYIIAAEADRRAIERGLWHGKSPIAEWIRQRHAKPEPTFQGVPLKTEHLCCTKCVELEVRVREIVREEIGPRIEKVADILMKQAEQILRLSGKP